ncbi:class I SAM-dependent methyltransferase [Cohnella algarum]|uniref:class I SAM-dependent methyltransferase n=1 Tax=Cohnella algarum TaxID=2044859 RepID=UPI0019683B57|nr:class I SAM-dependent methyltransferase [Cohnella algarum]MBN2982675.1 class I SAM-dependent methyltransferase [Cohnella algarum]
MELGEHPLGENPHSAGRAKEWIRQIRSDAEQLKAVLWSAEEWNAIGKTMEIWQSRMQNHRNDIIEHLNWYKNIGWKTFLPDAEQFEARANLEATAKEKARLAEWVEGNVRMSNFYLAFKRQLPESKLFGLLAQSGLPEIGRLSVLDASCGDGTWLRACIGRGAEPKRLAGVELSREALAEARRQSPPGVAYAHADPDDLPFASGSFDLILAVGLFMHMLDDGLRAAAAGELIRLLADGGMIVTFDFHSGTEKGLEPYLRYTTKGMDPEELGRLFAGLAVEYEYMPLSDKHPDYGYGFAAIRKSVGERGEPDAHES